MKKKLLVTLFTLCMVTSMAACGNNVISFNGSAYSKERIENVK